MHCKYVVFQTPSGERKVGICPKWKYHDADIVQTHPKEWTPISAGQFQVHQKDGKDSVVTFDKSWGLRLEPNVGDEDLIKAYLIEECFLDADKPMPDRPKCLASMDFSKLKPGVKLLNDRGQEVGELLTVHALGVNIKNSKGEVWVSLKDCADLYL